MGAKKKVLKVKPGSAQEKELMQMQQMVDSMEEPKELRRRGQKPTKQYISTEELFHELQPYKPEQWMNTALERKLGVGLLKFLCADGFLTNETSYRWDLQKGEQEVSERILDAFLFQVIKYFGLDWKQLKKERGETIVRLFSLSPPGKEHWISQVSWLYPLLGIEIPTSDSIPFLVQQREAFRHILPKQNVDWLFPSFILGEKEERREDSQPNLFEGFL